MRVAIFSAVGLITPALVCVGPTSAAPRPLDITSGAVTTSSTYAVRSGDSITKIAKLLQVSVDALLRANNLQLTTVIHPGQILLVPGPLAYTVVSGDSLFRIAGKIGVSLTSLLDANKLTATSLIKPGQALVIPAGGHAATAKAPSSSPPATTVPATTAPATTVPATPATAPTAPAATVPGSTTYTIVAGDYLASIATRSGVTLKALLGANNLLVTSLILPGMVLTVPPATLPIPAPTTTGADPTTTTTTAPTTTAPAAPVPATPDAAAASTASAGPTASQQQIDTVIAFLRAQVGKAYSFNTAGPDAYDCSGLVTAAYLQIGISLPHQSLLQSRKGTAVDWLTQPLLPGDLIFQFSSATPTVIGHVGIVVDATHWIQASRPGVPIAIGGLPAASKIQAVRRIVQP